MCICVYILGLHNISYAIFNAHLVSKSGGLKYIKNRFGIGS